MVWKGLTELGVVNNPLHCLNPSPYLEKLDPLPFVCTLETRIVCVRMTLSVFVCARDTTSIILRKIKTSSKRHHPDISSCILMRKKMY